MVFITGIWFTKPNEIWFYLVFSKSTIFGETYSQNLGVLVKWPLMNEPAASFYEKLGLYVFQVFFHFVIKNNDISK